MKRFLTLLLALTLLLTACGTAPASQKNKRTITDQAGFTVELPEKVERIVVCDILPLPSVLSVFFDSADKIVGMSGTSMNAAENSLLGQLYPEILNAETGFIDGSTVNTEELLKLRPDVVFYNASRAELGQQLRTAGFPAVAISVNKWDYDCIETLNNWIALLSEIFPDNDRTETVKNYSDKVLGMVRDRISAIPADQRERVLFLFQYSETNILTSGAKFFGQWWADATGAINVAEELTTDNSVAVNMEQIYAWNPSVILLTNFTSAGPDDIYNNTVGVYDWSAIDAVQSRRVYKMPLGMYRSYTPGADTPVTLLWLAKTLYPTYFEDVDILAETKAYYKEVFGVELTDSQAESIFAPAADAGTGF